MSMVAGGRGSKSGEGADKFGAVYENLSVTGRGCLQRGGGIVTESRR